MNCKKCGNEMADSAKFCSVCGNELQKNKGVKIKKFLLIPGFLLVAVACLWLGYKGGERHERDAWNELLGIEEAKKEDISVKDERSVMALVYSLPDDSKKIWTNEWIESETNVSFENVSMKLPKRGTISFKLAYPKKGNRNREESFEVFLNDGGKLLWQYDMVAEGDVGKDWSYVEYSYGYELEKELTTILFKTHSAKGSKGTLFGIGDIIVTDAETNEQYKMDLTDADTQVTCRAGDFMTNRVTDCEYEILELNQ